MKTLFWTNERTNKRRKRRKIPKLLQQIRTWMMYHSIMKININFIERAFSCSDRIIQTSIHTQILAYTGWVEIYCTFSRMYSCMGVRVCATSWRKLISEQHKCVIHILILFSSGFFSFKEVNLCSEHYLQPFIILFGAGIQVDKTHFHNICTHHTCSEQRECNVSSKFWFKKNCFQLSLTQR